jgi:hypothetical protein
MSYHAGILGKRELARRQAMCPITARGGVVELTRDQARRTLDERTRRIARMPLSEFERRYEAGTLNLDDPDIFSLVMQLPLAR